MSQVVAQEYARAFLAVFFAAVLGLYYRRHDRSYLRHWVWAWVGMAAYYLSGIVGGGLGAASPVDPLRLLGTMSFIVAGHLGVLGFFLGAREVARRKPPNPRIALYSAIAVTIFAVSVVLLTTSATWETRFLLRVGIIRGWMGLILVMLAWGFWRSGFAGLGIGRRLVSWAFFFAGLQLVVQATMHVLLAVGLVAIRANLGLFALADTVFMAILGLSMLVWFFEAEWDWATEAERALRSSDARLQAAFTGAPFDFWVCDTDKRYLYQNQVAIDRWGDFRGRRLQDLDLPAEPKKRMLHDYDRALSGEIVQKEFETLHKGVIQTRYHVFAPFEADGEIQGFVGLNLDVTPHRKTMAESELLRARLRRSQKLESVGTLAGGLAHDFNNLLQVVVGYVEATQSEDETVRQRAVEAIRSAAGSASELTRQLLAFSSQQSLEPEATDLNQLIAGMAPMVQPLMTAATPLSLISDPDLATVEVDRGQVEQVLMNVCLNARDAMPAGGHLTVRTENVLINGAYTKQHPGARPGRFVLIEVTDTGRGMTPETLHRVFEPFFTTKETGEGRGLGLAMVYGIVKQHGGMINVYSEVGLGTSVKLYFPVSERQADRVESMVAEVPGGTETILVAEDNAMVREMTHTILAEAGYNVILACDGVEAVSLWRARKDEIDLVLLDAIMPKMDGRGAFEAMQEVDPTVVVIFTSGYADGAFPADFLEKRDIPMLVKPIEPDAMLREIRSILDR